jgi:hypothetical protein
MRALLASGVLLRPLLLVPARCTADVCNTTHWRLHKAAVLWYHRLSYHHMRTVYAAAIVTTSKQDSCRNDEQRVCTHANDKDEQA